MLNWHQYTDKLWIWGISLLTLGIFLSSAFAAPPAERLVTDQRSIKVKVPKEIKRLVTISDGLVASVMTALGAADRIVGLGSSCIPKHWEYTYPSEDGRVKKYRDGMNIVTWLNPWMMNLPLIAQSGGGINYETLAGLEPDVVILRIGDCTVGARDEKAAAAIRMIESMGIPLIVLYGPSTYKQPNLATISAEIRIIADLLDKSKSGEQLSAYLESETEKVRQRTITVAEHERPTVMLFGLSPRAREAGGSGIVRGLGTMDSVLLENIVHARNAFRQTGASLTLGTEQVLALDPDVIILITAFGYHPPQELYYAPYYKHLSELKAVKHKRVAALPWTPCNCDKRLEYPIDVMVMAKTVYPDLFTDIELNAWLLDFYQKVYQVDVETAQALRNCQWMDWIIE